MNNPGNPSHSHVDKEQAGQWLARIDRGLSAEEHAALDEWLRDPQHRDVLFYLARDWDSMSVIAELAELFPLRPTEGMNWRFAGRIAASLAIVVALVWAMISGRMHPPAVPTVWIAAQPAAPSVPSEPLFAAVYSTAIGERRTIELPDRSRIDLNTNTELRVTFSDHARQLTMSRGEAMFEVAKDPGRVFTVQVAGYDFKAIGTAFDIRADSPKGLRITVTEGRVRVNRSAMGTGRDGTHGDLPMGFEEVADVEVDANKALSIGDRSTRIDALTPDQVAATTAWQHGATVFEATPLAQVVSELERYSTERFVIADPALARIPVTGYFEVGDIDSLAAALQQNVGIKITEHKGYLLLSSDR